MKIDVPKISYDCSGFNSETMMAQVDPNTNIIYIKKSEKENPDQLFAVAHELRHIWQIKNERDLFFLHYKTIDSCESVKEYNLQIAELDANAFAGIVMEDLFEITPLFNALDKEVKNKIHKRMKYIREINNKKGSERHERSKN